MVQLLKFGIKFSILALVIAMLMPIAVAQEAKLEMKFVGYGKSYQEIHISFKNIGETMISDITLYINDEAYKTIEGASGPGIVFEEVLFLEEGKHLIEARTPEGAYASLEVTASEGEIEKEEPVKKPETSKEPGIFDWVMENMLWIVLAVAIIVFVISIWSIRKGAYAKKR